MAIVITKKGKQINSHKVDVVCDECECEFTCDNTDFENGIIECPNCKNIIYQHTLPYNNMGTFSAYLFKSSTIFLNLLTSASSIAEFKMIYFKALP